MRLRDGRHVDLTPHPVFAWIQLRHDVTNTHFVASEEVNNREQLALKSTRRDSNHGRYSCTYYWTVPELLFEKKGLIPAIQQLLVLNK